MPAARGWWKMTVISYPLKTGSGVAYRPPVQDHGYRCPGCKYFVACRETVIEKDGFAFCEGVIEEEVEEVYARD